MSKYFVVLAVLGLAACGSKAEAPAADSTAAAAPAPAPADSAKPDSTKVAGDTAKKP